MTDAELCQAVEQGRMPEGGFAHREHLRLAWIYLERFGPTASTRIAGTIRNFAESQGQPGKFHHTITWAWMWLVRNRMAHARDAQNSQEFLARCPQLLDKDALLRYYSLERLHSPAARQGWLEPDREPLPEYLVTASEAS